MSVCQVSRGLTGPGRLQQAHLQRSWSVASGRASASVALLSNSHGPLPRSTLVSSLFRKCFLSCIRRCAWLRSRASFAAMGKRKGQ